jgi:hypothetical protein
MAAAVVRVPLADENASFLLGVHVMEGPDAPQRVQVAALVTARALPRESLLPDEVAESIAEELIEEGWS